MSVGIFIDNPKTKQEKAFYIPIATDNIFEKYWLRASYELKLSWIPLFRKGVVISVKDVRNIIDELEQLRIWLLKCCLESEEEQQIDERIICMVEELPQIFVRKDILLFIGKVS